MTEHNVELTEMLVNILDFHASYSRWIIIDTLCMLVKGLNLWKNSIFLPERCQYVTDFSVLTEKKAKTKQIATYYINHTGKL